MRSPEESNGGPVIRDLRRIDPATGQIRDPGQGGSAQPGSSRGSGKSRPGKHAAGAAGSRQGQGGPAGADRKDAAARSAAEQKTAEQLAERTADLQRLSAEYANYRKRVERDRVAVREQALANVLFGLLPVLDDIGRAREHGELAGGFKSVADSLETTVAKLGLERFGENGEPFDPKVHEALMHSYSNDVTEPTCVQILQPGYRVGERILPRRGNRMSPATRKGRKGRTTGPAGRTGPMGPAGREASTTSPAARQAGPAATRPAGRRHVTKTDARRGQ